MPTAFPLFGLVHLALLLSVPLVAWAFVLVGRSSPQHERFARYAMALATFISAMMYYGELAVHGQLTYPEHVPLELCDISGFLAVFVLLTLNKYGYDLVYYTGLAGAGMSLLTPNLPQDANLYRISQYFLDHGFIVAAVLYLLWSGQLRPRRGSVLRTLLAVNIYAMFVGIFDAIYKTDYMFLCRKPDQITLLTYLGPWPWYILATEFVGFALFALLYWPCREKSVQAAEEEAA